MYEAAFKIRLHVLLWSSTWLLNVQNCSNKFCFVSSVFEHLIMTEWAAQAILVMKFKKSSTFSYLLM